MDLQQGVSLILDYFSSSDVYCPETDYKRLNTNLLKEKEDDILPQEWEIKLAIQGALEEMCSENFVKKIETGTNKNKQTSYLINESIQDAPITLQLSKETAQNVVSVAQNFLPFIDMDINVSLKPEGISEAEIILLLQITNVLANRLQELENKSKPQNTKTDTENNELE